MSKNKRKPNTRIPRKQRFYYQDNKGLRVGVTREHILTAIKIKLELQKGSPSHRCSWTVHKKMMMSEGFHDSATTESYRKFIGWHQEQEGLLMAKEKYVDVLSEKKIESMKDLTGELFIARRDTQNTQRELNKLRREIADGLIVVDSIREEIIKKDFRKKLNKITVSNIDMNTAFEGYEGILTPSDWHVGLQNEWVDLKEIRRRVINYATNSTKELIAHGVTRVYVTNIGDIVNNVYMHNNTQAFNSEFGFAQQMVEASSLMVEFLTMMSDNFEVIYLGTIEGNHGRMSKKGETLYDDSAEYVIHHMVKSILENSSVKNIVVDDSNWEKIRVLHPINGLETLFVHGHGEQKNSPNKISKYLSIYSKNIDLMIHGHFHSFTVQSENHHRKIITSGALVGSDDFARSLGYYTNASQLLTLVKGKSIVPIEIQVI